MRICDYCAEPIESKSRNARFCSPECRARNKDTPRPPTAVPLQAVPDPATGLVDALTKELADAKRLDTVLGQQALALAVKMSGFESGSSLAALSKELRTVMAEATRGAEVAADPLDELKLRRDRKSG